VDGTNSTKTVSEMYNTYGHKKRDPAVIGLNADPQRNSGSRSITLEVKSLAAASHIAFPGIRFEAERV
jgi:hypothetical protein